MHILYFWCHTSTKPSAHNQEFASLFVGDLSYRGALHQKICLCCLLVAVSVEACRRNIKFNGSVASSKVDSQLADARVYMLTHPKEFDVVLSLSLSLSRRDIKKKIFVSKGMTFQIPIVPVI